MKHRPVPHAFICGRYPPSLYLDFVNEGFGYGQDALVSHGGNATCPQAGTISDISWANIPAWTIFAHAKLNTTPGFQNIFCIDDGTTNNLAAEIQWDGSQLLAITNQAGSVSSVGTGAFTGTNPFKFIYSYKDGVKQYCVNGGKFFTASATSNPTSLTTARLGNRVSGNALDGNIFRVAYWPAALPEQFMQVITAL